MPALRGVALALALTATATAAQARPDVRALSCASARSLVAQSGAVVLTTGRHTFERFVRSRAWCDPWEWAQPRVVPSADRGRCVLLVCQRVPFDDNDLFFDH